jgi:membrane protein, antimicrobial resistance system
MDPILDLFRVIYEPAAVFERVREHRKFLIPFIGFSIIAMIVAFLMAPYRQAATMAQMAAAAQANPGAAATASKVAALTWLAAPVGVLVLVAIAASILWVLVSLVGGEASWRTLACIQFYIGISTIIYQLVVFGMLAMGGGVSTVHSPNDLMPPLGLDLLAPHAGPALTRLLGGVNPFTLWGVFLTAVGVQVTQKTSKGSAWTVAIISFAISLGLGTLAGLLQPK